MQLFKINIEIKRFLLNSNINLLTLIRLNHSDTLQPYLDANTGFKNIQFTDRNKWYLNLAKKELNDLSTIYKEKLIKILGIEDAEGTINIWKKMIEVLEKGEHRPGHFYAEKPI